jgi:hypothetical protein
MAIVQRVMRTELRCSMERLSPLQVPFMRAGKKMNGKVLI